MGQQLTSPSRDARPHADRFASRLAARILPPAAALLAAAAPAAAAAQAVLGAGPSAFVVPRGVVRLGVTQDWRSFDETFGAPGDTGTAAVPLGSRLSAASFGAAQLPRLGAVETDLRLLSGQSGFALSLGPAAVTSTATVRTTNVELELGVLPGLSLGVAVPLVRSASSVGIALGGAAGDANVGLNPARFGATSGTAASANAQVKSGFDQAAQRLRQQYSSCFGPTGTPTGAAGCADAVQLYQQATAYATALGRVYGTAPQSGAGVVPIAGSAAQRAVDATIASYNARFRALFGDPATAPAPITGALQGAAPVTETDFQTLVGNAATGFGGDTLRATSHITLGDIEVGVRLRLLDTFRGREATRVTPRGVNFRTAVAGTFRVGTGHVDSPDDLLDVATGDGQNDVEVGSFTDLMFGPRFWISVAGRYGRQLADEQDVRIPASPDEAGGYLPLYSRQRVARDLGDYVEVEATPRYAVGSAYAIEGRYLFRTKQSDRYTGTFPVPDGESGVPGLVLDASTLDAGTELREQRVGGAVSYSTYPAYTRGRARLPLELSLSYLRTVAGRGAVPRLDVVQLQLRAFPRLFGAEQRRARPAAAPTR